MRLLLALLLLLSGPGWAQGAPPEARLAQAAQAFGKGQYGAAATLYEDLLRDGFDDYRIHYNLGLVHQTLNHKGLARAHYEKARLLRPFEADVAQNLARLRSSLDDNEPDTPASRQFASLFSGTSLFVLLSLAHGGLWYNAWKYYRKGQRELHLWSMLVCLALVVACAGLALVRLHLPEQAAVIPASVVLKNGPGREFTESLSLHAGVLVDIVRREGDWTEVEALGNVRAWIPETDLARLNPTR